MPVYLVIPFSEVRVKIVVNGGSKVNDTIPADSSLWQPGQNVVYNDTFNDTMHTETGKAFHVVTQAALTSYHFKGYRCDPCYVPKPVIVNPDELPFRYWSNPADWPSGELPKEGEDIEIETGWKMVFDLPESPHYRYLEVNGFLYFQNDTDLILNVDHIYVRAGVL